MSAASTDPAAGRATLTGRGIAACAGAGALVLIGALVGIVELYVLAGADVVVVAAALAWVRSRRWALGARRALHPTRIESGATLRVELVVHNRAPLRSPPLVLRDPFAGGASHATLRLAPLAAGQSERAEYRVTAPTRGRFELGPLEVVLVDPLGLVRWSRRAAGISTVHVHPPVEILHVVPPSSDGERRGEQGALAPAASGDEFYALRPYRVGDDLRRVHWAATARADELVVRQDESSQGGAVTIAVDLRAGAWDGPSLETALSAAASVAATAQRAGLTVRLVTTDGTDTGWLAPGALDPLLDVLTSAVPHDGPGLPLARVARGAGAGAVVVIGSDASDVMAVLRSSRAGGASPTVVVVDRRASPGGQVQAGPPGAGPPAPGGRPVPGAVRLAPGQPVAAAWDAVLGGRAAVGSLG